MANKQTIKAIPFAVAMQLQSIIQKFKAPRHMGDITKFIEISKVFEVVSQEFDQARTQVFAEAGVGANELIQPSDERYPSLVEKLNEIKDSSVQAKALQVYTEEEVLHQCVDNLSTPESALVVQWLVKP